LVESEHLAQDAVFPVVLQNSGSIQAEVHLLVMQASSSVVPAAPISDPGPKWVSGVSQSEQAAKRFGGED
jgi:hypothetical protein